MNDDNLKGKFDSADKEKLEKAISDTLSWIDAHLEGPKEDFEKKQKELESVANPIMTKLYGAAGGAAGMPGAAPGGFPGAAPGAAPSSGGGDGPTIEEVD
jgi:L1 cell adhesion molecule like protein